MKEYILIDSESINVELFARSEANAWQLNEMKSLDDILTISTVQLSFALIDIYKGTKL